MADLNDIVTQVLDLTLESRPEDTLLAEQYIREGQREAEMRFGFRAMEESAEFTTVKDQRKLGDKPTDWLRMRSSPYYYDGWGKVREVEWLPSERDMHRIYNDRNVIEVGPPRHVWELLTQFEVYPLPDGISPVGDVYGDGEYRVMLPYWKRLPALTTTGTPVLTNWWTDNAERYLVNYSAYRVLQRYREREEWLLYKAESEAEFSRLKKLDNRSRIPRSTQLRANHGAQAPFNQERW